MKWSLVAVLTKMVCQGEFYGGKLPFYFLLKIAWMEGCKIQWVNTVLSYSRSNLAALHCFTSQREVNSKKSDAKPLAILHIKAITLIELIRSPLQPKIHWMSHLGPLPLMEGYQQNPNQKGLKELFSWRCFGNKEIHLSQEGFVKHSHPNDWFFQSVILQC